MALISNRERATALVHEGWNHLQCQRPLAARGSWQRALALEPDSQPAKKAIETLEGAGDLPLAARLKYRLRKPADPLGRATWDEKLSQTETDDLIGMADAFGRLANEIAGDSSAWFNRALCLAWAGENLDAIAALDQVVRIDARIRFDDAVEAWSLAEILRQGGGAETLADDLRFAFTIAWGARETCWLLDEFPELRRVRTPRPPGGPADDAAEIEVYEWYDRPLEAAAGAARSARDLPTVLASVYTNGESLRGSSPRLRSLQQIEEILLPRLEDRERSIKREASPLPLPFLDADIWTFRIPAGIEREQADELARSAVEAYYENEWIHHPRASLGGESPLQSARAAKSGDDVARARLTAVIQIRQQLGERPTARSLYQGYPFDRLRNRLEMAIEDPAMIDRDDLSCASGARLDEIDPAALDDALLGEAIASALGLRDDARTARLSAEYLTRQHPAVPRVEITDLVAPLVRQAMGRNDPDGALHWIERARVLAADAGAKALDVWRAEILARIDRPGAALALYRLLITPDRDGAALALDGGETLLENGHEQEAESLLETARQLAQDTGREWIERRARELLTMRGR